MRYEGKNEMEAVAAAAREIGVEPTQVRYRVVRDEKSFWGGRVVEIEVEEEPSRRPAAAAAAGEAPREPAPAGSEPRAGLVSAVERLEPSMETGFEESSAPAGEAPALDEESWGAVEATLTELLSAAGFLVEIRRRPSAEEMVFELIGDDVEPLLANRGEGLNGLEVLAGRIAMRRVGHPVHPRLDAEGFRRHQRETLEELAHRSADEAKRTRRPQLLPPLSPAERRLVHLALAQDPEVETESEGSGFLKRVAVRLKRA
ncbi:MAG TPA: R3H domain-containing nucleic acid-binding protein [Thermoanaerobaculia bacterium]|nr:R3H domain-containing nucleic acid-binding protein [Thermoanaerobaculia bacterium]